MFSVELHALSCKWSTPTVTVRLGRNQASGRQTTTIVLQVGLHWCFVGLVDLST